MFPLLGTPMEGSLGPLMPEHPIEIIVGVVLLLLVILVCWKSVVPAFEKAYAERTDAIQGGMERAARAQAEAQQAKEQYSAQLNDSRDEAARIREEAKNQGAQILAEMRDQANRESERILQAAHAQIEAERTQAMNQLTSQIGGMATTLAGRIVGESLDDDQRARNTVDRFLAELETQAANGGQQA